jgi:hypothetical protein
LSWLNDLLARRSISNFKSEETLNLIDERVKWASALLQLWIMLAKGTRLGDGLKWEQEQLREVLL